MPQQRPLKTGIAGGRKKPTVKKASPAAQQKRIANKAARRVS